MHMHLSWRDATGTTKVHPKSLETIQEAFADNPVAVLDFLQDCIGILIQEYNDSVDAFEQRMGAKQEIDQ